MHPAGLAHTVIGVQSASKKDSKTATQRYRGPGPP